MLITQFHVDGFVATCHGPISSIPVIDWDACGTADHPLLQHRHLLILEECGLVAPEAGFQPHHLLLRDSDGTPVGAAPAFLKTSSSGEMGVDLGLPLAHIRAAGPYYPKLQVEIPMVPTPGPRLLVRPGQDIERVQRALLDGLRQLADHLGASSVQIGYMTASEQALAAATGFTPCEGNIFVWRSRGEGSFAEFVASMHQKGRYRIRHERQQVAALGLTFDRLHTSRLTPDLAPKVFELYTSTFRRYGTTPYLTLPYFEAVFRSMPDVFELLIVRHGMKWNAALMNLRGGTTYHVQHWGVTEQTGNLVFEMFYRSLEHAIGSGYPVVDFGATGQHKTLRGIGIEATRHALWFRNPAFQVIATAACARRCAAAAQEREVESLKLPFKDKQARVELHA